MCTCLCSRARATLTPRSAWRHSAKEALARTPRPLSSVSWSWKNKKPFTCNRTRPTRTSSPHPDPSSTIRKAKNRLIELQCSLGSARSASCTSSTFVSLCQFPRVKLKSHFDYMSHTVCLCVCLKTCTYSFCLFLTLFFREKLGSMKEHFCLKLFVRLFLLGLRLHTVSDTRYGFHNPKYFKWSARSFECIYFFIVILSLQHVVQLLVDWNVLHVQFVFRTSSSCVYLKHRHLKKKKNPLYVTELHQVSHVILVF